MISVGLSLVGLAMRRGSGAAPSPATETIGDRVNYAPADSEYLAYAAPWSLFNDSTAGIPAYVTNSSSQLTLQPARHTLIVQPNKGFVQGRRIVMLIVGDPDLPNYANNMEGTCFSYNATTGQLVVDVVEGDPIGGQGLSSSYWLVIQKAVEGIDYEDTITVTPSVFPNRTTFYSRWPDAPGGGDGARGYNSINHGNGNRAVVGQPIEAVAVIDLYNATAVLKHYFKWSLLSGAPDNYNVLGEAYTTAQKDNQDTKTAEVAFFPYAPTGTINYANDGDQYGLFTDSDGIVWRVGRQPSGDAGNFIMMIQQGGAPIYEGTLHYDEAIAWLMENGHIAFTDWVNGSMFGIEPKRGEARVFLEQFSSVMEAA